MQKLYAVKSQRNEWNLYTGDQLVYYDVHLDHSLTEPALETLRSCFNRYWLWRMLWDAAQQRGGHWCVVIYPRDYVLGQHVAEVRGTSTQLRYSSLMARVEMEHYGIEYCRAWMSILYIPQKSLLKKLAAKSDVFASLYAQLKDVDADKQWVYFADDLDETCLNKYKHYKADLLELERKIGPKPVITESFSAEARNYCSMAERLDREFGYEVHSRRLEYLEAAVQVGPHDGHAWHMLALEYGKFAFDDKVKARKSLHAYLKARRYEAPDMDVKDIAGAFESAGMPRAALKMLIHEFMVRPDPDIIYEIVRALISVRNMDEAFNCCMAVCAFENNACSMVQHVIEHCLRLDARKAEELIKRFESRGLISAGDDAWLYIMKAEIFYKLQRLQEAGHWLELHFKYRTNDMYISGEDYLLLKLRLQEDRRHEAWFGLLYGVGGRWRDLPTEVMPMAIERKQFRLAERLKHGNSFEQQENCTLYYEWQKLMRENKVPLGQLPPDPLPQYVFKDGVLYVQNQGRDIAIKGVNASEQMKDGRLVHLNLPLRLLRPGYAEQISDARDEKEKTLAQWRASLPPRLVEFVQPFGDCQLPLLQLLMARPNWIEQYPPALLYMAANYQLFNIGWPYRTTGESLEIIENILENRSAFIERLDLRGYSDETNPWLWLPEKMGGYGLSIRGILKYTGMISRYMDVALLRDVPAITSDTLALLINWDLEHYPELLNLFELVSQTPSLPIGYPDIPTIMATYLHVTACKSTRPVHCTADLLALMDESSERMLNNPHVPLPYYARRARYETKRFGPYSRDIQWIYKRQNSVAHAPFPYPPLEPIAGIVPIKNPEELKQEAREMHNGFAAYLMHRMHWGTRFIYCVHEPERATLCVSSEGNAIDRWRIEWLLRENLRPVTLETYREIERWVISRQLGV